MLPNKDVALKFLKPDSIIPINRVPRTPVIVAPKAANKASHHLAFNLFLLKTNNQTKDMMVEIPIIIISCQCAWKNAFIL